MRQLLQALVVSLALTFAPAAYARPESISFKVTDAAGNPLANAVIMSPAGTAGSAAPGQGSYVMKQEGIAFHPFVLVVPVGANVSFPNLDRVRHHVYSFSRGNRFELKLYGREETRSVRFDTAGIVAIGCNIHDEMVAYIRVVESSVYGVTDDAGELAMHIPPGTTRVIGWHPDALHSETFVELPAGTSGPITIALKTKRKRHGH